MYVVHLNHTEFCSAVILAMLSRVHKVEYRVEIL